MNRSAPFLPVQVYGSSYDEDPSRTETDVLEPTNPYAATKAAAENIVKSYWTSFKFPVSTAACRVSGLQALLHVAWL